MRILRAIFKTVGSAEQILIHHHDDQLGKVDAGFGGKTTKRLVGGNRASPPRTSQQVMPTACGCRYYTA